MVGEGDGRFVFVDVQIQWPAQEMTGDRGCRWRRQWRGGQRDAAAVMPPTELGIVGSGKLDAHYMYVHDQYFTHTTRLQHFR
jgi:hypothetical protein